MKLVLCLDLHLVTCSYLIVLPQIISEPLLKQQHNIGHIEIKLLVNEAGGLR